MDLRTEEIRNRLKEERIRQGLSVNKVYTMVMEAGFYTSQTTAKRIFGDDPGGIKYETLQPYVTVLFGTNEPTEERKVGDEEQAEDFRAQLDNIKHLLDLKNAQLEAKNNEIDTLKNQVDYLKTRVDDVKELFYTGRTNDQETIKVQRKYILSMSIILFVIITFLVGILIYDLTNTNVGWVRDIAYRITHAVETTGLLL